MGPSDRLTILIWFNCVMKLACPGLTAFPLFIPQGLMLLILGPVLDMQVSGKWVWDYEPSVPSMQCLALSCAVAAMVSARPAS